MATIGKFKKLDSTARMSLTFPRSMREKLLVLQEMVEGTDKVQVTLSEVLEQVLLVYWDQDKVAQKCLKDMPKHKVEALSNQLEEQEGKKVEAEGATLQRQRLLRQLPPQHQQHSLALHTHPEFNQAVLVSVHPRFPGVFF